MFQNADDENEGGQKVTERDDSHDVTNRHPARESETERTVNIDYQVEVEVEAKAVPDYSEYMYTPSQSDQSLELVPRSTLPSSSHDTPPCLPSHTPTSSPHSQPHDRPEQYHVPIPETDPSNSSCGTGITLMGNILAQPEPSPVNTPEEHDECETPRQKLANGFHPSQGPVSADSPFDRPSSAERGRPTQYSRTQQNTSRPEIHSDPLSLHEDNPQHGVNQILHDLHTRDPPYNDNQLEAPSMATTIDLGGDEEPSMPSMPSSASAGGGG